RSGNESRLRPWWTLPTPRRRPTSSGTPCEACASPTLVSRKGTLRDPRHARPYTVNRGGPEVSRLVEVRQRVLDAGIDRQDPAKRSHLQQLLELLRRAHDAEIATCPPSQLEPNDHGP